MAYFVCQGIRKVCFFVRIQIAVAPRMGGRYDPRVLVGRLLSNLDIRVEPFSLCEVGPGRRLRLPASARVMLHFVLVGSGSVRSAAGTVQPLKTCSLAVVPKGAPHSLEPGGEIANECVIDPDSETLPSAP